MLHDRAHEEDCQRPGHHLYAPLPADISGVSCEHGEVNADVFDMHRVGMYKEASYKPYAIAAMMFLQKVADPAATLKALDERNTARWLQA